MRNAAIRKHSWLRLLANGAGSFLSGFVFFHGLLFQPYRSRCVGNQLSSDAMTAIGNAWIFSIGTHLCLSIGFIYTPSIICSPHLIIISGVTYTGMYFVSYHCKMVDTRRKIKMLHGTRITF